MRKVEHIEKQIELLSGAEFAELRDWLLEKEQQAWDVQIEHDAKNGKFDNLLSEASADFVAGRSRGL